MGLRGATRRSACPILRHSESGPLVYLCANVGLQGLPVVRLPALFVPHSASLGPAVAARVLSAPPAVYAPPTGLDECLFFISLVLDFLAVRFSVCSGCARRRSVSTYATILVLPKMRFHNTLRIGLNLKLMNCLFLEFSIEYFQPVVNCGN